MSPGGEMMRIRHPISGQAIIGSRLHPGEIIQKGDVYDSTDGKWREDIKFLGTAIPKGNPIIWVRPEPELKEE